MLKKRIFFVGLATITLLLTVAILTDTLPWLRGPQPDSAVWHWPYLLRPFTRWWPAMLAGAIFLLILGWWLQREQSSEVETPLVLTILAVVIFVLQLGLIYASRPQIAAELIDRTLAVQTNGYFWTAANVDDLETMLRQYPAAMGNFESEHAQTHPPGLILLNWLTIQLMAGQLQAAEAIARQVQPLRCTDLWLLNQETAVPAALGIWAILPLLAASTIVFPAYKLAASLSNSTSSKLAVSTGLIPSLLLFAPLPDQLFCILTLFVVISFYYGWRNKKNWLFLLAGILLSLATFLSIGNAAILVLLGTYALINLWLKPEKRSHIIVWAGLFVFGLITVWLIFWAGWGITPWAIIQTGMSQHYELVTSQRSYTTWFGFNLLDLILFAGLPAMVAFVFLLTTVAQTIHHRSLTDNQIIALSTAVLILILDISGSTRGEVGRIWLFLMPLILISGSIFLNERLSAWQLKLGWAGMQLVSVLAIGFSWQPISANIVSVQEPLLPQLPQNTIPIEITFGETILLESFLLEELEDKLELTLVWQTKTKVRRPFTVFNHLVNESGELVAQQDNWPVNGQWPPNCWKPGESIPDSYSITLPPDLQSGEYFLHTGLYDSHDGTRLTTSDNIDSLNLAVIVRD